jgi:hypothetical protein
MAAGQRRKLAPFLLGVSFAMALAVGVLLAARCNSAPQEAEETDLLDRASGGSWRGSFDLPRQEISCGNSGLTLKLVFALEEGVAPGMTYAVRETLGGTRFAYFCIVLHKDTSDVSCDFPFDCSVRDNRGQIAQSLKIGKLNSKMAYSLVVGRGGEQGKDKETLTIQGKKVDLGDGRLFVVDLTGDAVVIKQVADPSIDAPTTEAAKTEETVNRVLRDVRDQLDEGKLKARVLKAD